MNKNTVNVLDNIGNTPLVKATSLGRFLGIENLYLKIESYNPTGTYKDRATKKVLEDAINSKAKGITIATCGNFGFSIATFCKESALPCNIFIPRRYSTDKGEKIERLGAIVTYTEGSYEDAVDTSVQYALDCGFYNANPSCPHSADLAMEGYAFMSNEIIEQLRGNPIGSVWSAVGNGTGLAGMYKGFKRIIKDLPSFGIWSGI